MTSLEATVSVIIGTTVFYWLVLTIMRLTEIPSNTLRGFLK